MNRYRLYDLTVNETTYEGIDDIDVHMLLQRELRRRIIDEQTIRIEQTPTLSTIVKIAVEHALGEWGGEETTITIGRFTAQICENQSIQD